MLYSKKRARLISRSGKYIFQYFERHGLSSSAGGMFEIDPVARYVTILNGYNRYLKKGQSYCNVCTPDYYPMEVDYPQKRLRHVSFRHVVFHFNPNMQYSMGCTGNPINNHYISPLFEMKTIGVMQKSTLMLNLNCNNQIKKCQ